MAGLKDGDDFKDGEFFKAPPVLKLACLGVGVVGTVIFFLISIFAEGMRGAMGYSWLFAVTFFLTLAIGGLFWTLLHHATNSGWGTVVRRLMENLAIMIPFVLVLSLPIVFIPSFRDALWEWFPKSEAAMEVASHKAEEHREEYQKAGQEKIKAAQAELEKAKGDLAAIESPTPGHRAYFDRKIQTLGDKLAALEASDLSEQGAIAALEDKYFQEEAALLFSKRGFLNTGFWYFRFFFYIVALGGIAYVLRLWSTRNDKDPDPKWFRWMRRWSCGFFPFFATAWTFLVFDWLMALDYTWFSTMWGVYLFAGCALNSMGFLILLLTALRRAGYLKTVVTMEHYHLMGKLMHAFVIFWAYIAFSQFFLIWYANITEETKFYLARNTEFWNTYTVTLLVVGHFFIPFVILLLRKVKKLPMVISAVAIWNLAMHFLDIYWIIIPERGPSLTAGSEGGISMTIPGAFWFDILAWVSVAGLFGFALLKMLSTASLFPCRDPRLDESLNVVN